MGDLRDAVGGIMTMTGKKAKNTPKEENGRVCLAWGERDNALHSYYNSVFMKAR